MKIKTLALICLAELVALAFLLGERRVFFDGEYVSFKLPMFSGEGTVKSSELRAIEGANDLVLCYRIRIINTGKNDSKISSQGDEMWIPGKFVKSKLKIFERRRLLSH